MPKKVKLFLKLFLKELTYKKSFLIVGALEN